MFRLRYFVIFLAFSYNNVVGASNTTIDEFPASLLQYVKGNSLWTGILQDCKKPTMLCIQNQVFKYLKTTLDHTDDVEFTSFMKFSKNNVDYSNIKRSLDLQNDTVEEYSEPSSPLEDMSRSLQDNTLKFLMTHNLELQLPETLFQSAILKLSPRSIEGTGALVKMEFLPPPDFELDHAQGRTFKKIRKFIGEKLMYALMAILMIIKMLAVKFLFILPAVMGVAAAKKLIFKLLLFVFPALHHLFKWCAYVPHGTKFHHHKHHISHIHHIDGHPIHGPPHIHDHGPPVHFDHGGHDIGGHDHGHYEVIAPHSDGPPSLHHTFESHEPPGGYKHYYQPDENLELQYAYEGPAFGGDYITTHRHDQKYPYSENEIYPWGQGQGNRRTKPDPNKPLTSQEIETMVLKAEKEALIKARLQQEKLKIQEENLRLQQQLNNAIKLQEKLKQQASFLTKKTPVNQNVRTPSVYLQSPPPTNVPPNHTPNGLQSVAITAGQQSPTVVYPQITGQQVTQQLTLEQQQKIAEVLKKKQQQQFQNHVNSAEKKQSQSNPYEQELMKAASITYDPFYSPILAKIDNILKGLGFIEEPCRERLICSMYKNPAKFSPHSNLVSAELSRDSEELQKPTNTNAAVIRFYKYVQAARDGQDKRDCIRLYPTCAINTEK